VAASWAVSQALNILQLVVLLVIPIGAYYVLTDGGNLRRQLLLGLPPAWRPRVTMLIEASTDSLSRYVRGQTAVCFVTGILHSIGFAITGLPFWLIIGIMAGLAEAVPFLGSLVVVVTVAIVGLADSPRTAFFALFYYIVIGNQVANYLITPRLMSARLDVHPFVIILAALVGSSLGGPVGALIALPTAVVVQSVTRQMWGHVEEAESGS
jgi:predicted PurR-regulated permease PerM